MDDTMQEQDPPTMGRTQQCMDGAENKTVKRYIDHHVKFVLEVSLRMQSRQGI
jgi:hypothetical protein